MVVCIWLTVITFFKPERPRIDGIEGPGGQLGKATGPHEWQGKVRYRMVVVVLGLFMMKSFSPIPSSRTWTGRPL